MYHYYLFSISHTHNMVISPHHNTLGFSHSDFLELRKQVLVHCRLANSTLGDLEPIPSESWLQHTVYAFLSIFCGRDVAVN